MTASKDMIVELNNGQKICLYKKPVQLNQFFSVGQVMRSTLAKTVMREAAILALKQKMVNLLY